MTPPPPFSLLSKHLCPLCQLRGPVLFSLRQGLRIQADLEFTVTEMALNLTLYSLVLVGVAGYPHNTQLSIFFENHKYKLNHLHAQKTNVRALYLVRLGYRDSTEKVIIVGVLSNVKSTLENTHILEQ